MMTASPNDAWLRHIWGKHRIIASETSNIILSEAKNIISPQAMHHLTNNRFYGIIAVIGGVAMKENKLVELSMEFSVDIINLVKFLKSNHETIIANQIGRSGTSIGANIHEAQYAQGTRDFISKFEIALKEASETGYWLELLYRTKYIDEQTFKALSSKCTSLRVMLIASCKTAKENAK